MMQGLMKQNRNYKENIYNEMNEIFERILRFLCTNSKRRQFKITGMSII